MSRVKLSTHQVMVVVSGPSIRNNSGIRSFYADPNFDEIMSKLEEHTQIKIGNGFNDDTVRSKIHQKLRELWHGGGGVGIGGGGGGSPELTGIRGSPCGRSSPPQRMVPAMNTLDLRSSEGFDDAVAEVNSPTMAAIIEQATAGGARRRKSMADDYDDSDNQWHASFVPRPITQQNRLRGDEEAAPGVQFDDLWHHGAPDRKGQRTGTVQMQKQAMQRRAWQLKMPVNKRVQAQTVKNALPQLR
jgi:hypothetical protein